MGAKMGEVRAKLKLTNSIDEALARRGKLAADQVRTYQADALVDTGAVRTVLPADIVNLLGLAICGQRTSEYADGRCETVGVTEPVLVDWQGRDTVEDAIVAGGDVIVGMTVLGKLDLFVDAARGQLIPNPKHPDKPVSTIK